MQIASTEFSSEPTRTRLDVGRLGMQFKKARRQLRAAELLVRDKTFIVPCFLLFRTEVPVKFSVLGASSYVGEVMMMWMVLDLLLQLGIR